MDDVKLPNHKRITKHQKALIWRRQMKAIEASKGKTESEIATILHISQAQVSKDLKLVQQEYLVLHLHYEKELPKTISRCLTALNELIRINFRIVENSEDNKEIISASSLIATLLDKYVDLSTNEQLVKNSIDYITSIHAEAQQIKTHYEQQKREQERQIIEEKYALEHPKEFGEFDPQYVGHATS